MRPVSCGGDVVRKHSSPLPNIDTGLVTVTVDDNGMLKIKKHDLQRIYDHCDQAYPDEACGILAGRDRNVEKIYEMTNAKPSPSYYEMDPAEQLRVMKEIRQTGMELVGIYHSHTSSSAYPSNTDVKQAYFPETLYPNYPGAVYLIVTLMDRKNPGARGFTIEENAIAEVPVTVHPGADS